MKFELPFEENLYREQVKLTFKIAWEKYLSETKKTGIIALILIAIGIIILYGEGNVGGLFVVVGIVLIVSASMRLNKYNDAKKTTENISSENILKWKENPISIWEFEEDYFRFKFYGGDYKINWDNFKYYNVVDTTLFFGFRENGNWYSLSESELGKENFQKVAEFVNSKIKPATNSGFAQ